MTLALLCSGQGAQKAGMFALTADRPEAAALFAHASGLLGGRDPREYCGSVVDGYLFENRTAQILCTLQPLAIDAALRSALPGRMIVAGYSIGELAAWSVASILNPLETLDLAGRRAEVMDAASVSGDGLLSVRGLSRSTIDTLCRQTSVEIAIVNPGDAYVVGGAASELDAFAAEAAKVNSCRLRRLPVHVAAHTSRLGTASDAFRCVLRAASMNGSPAAEVRLFCGIDASHVVDAATSLDRLAKQISQTIVWAECLEACVEAGATAFLELGPGRALREMVVGAYPNLRTASVDDFKTIEGVAAWIALHGS